MKTIIIKVANGDLMIAASNLIMLVGLGLWGWLSVNFYEAHPNYWVWCIMSLFFLIGGAIMGNVFHHAMKKDEHMPIYIYGLPQFIQLIGVGVVMWWLKKVNIAFIKSTDIAMSEPIFGWIFAVTAAIVVLSLILFVILDD